MLQGGLIKFEVTQADFTPNLFLTLLQGSANEQALSILCELVSNDSVIQGRFGTDGVKDALVAMLRNAESPEAQRWGSAAICSLTQNNSENRTCFGTDEVKVALVGLMKTESLEAQRWGAAAICNLTANHPGNRTCFGTHEVKDALVAALTNAESPEAQRWGAAAIGNLTANHPGNRTCFGTDEVKDALVAVLRNAESPEANKRAAKEALEHLTRPQSVTQGQGKRPSTNDKESSAFFGGRKRPRTEGNNSLQCQSCVL